MERYEIDAPETQETPENFSEAPSNNYMKPIKLIDARKYEINFGEDNYSLILEMYSNDTISFKLRKINGLSLYQYSNRYNYKQLVKIFLTQKEKYRNLDQIFTFIDIAIINKQINIDYKEESNTMVLKIRKYLYSKEECLLELNSLRIPQDELISLLIEEVKNYKKTNKENNKKINELNLKIQGYEDYISNLENQIIKLEEELNKLNQDYDNYKSENQIGFYNINNIYNINIPKKEEKYAKPKILLDLTRDRSEYCGKLRNIDVFTGLKDNIEYMIYNDRIDHNLEIMRIRDKKIIHHLKGHKSETTVIRYYLKNKNTDYILSCDIDRLTIIWDIQNNFNKKYSIISNYSFMIWDAILLFNVNKLDYILLSSGGKKEFTKLYKFSDNTPFIRDIKYTDMYETYYLIPWKYKNEYYVIECCDKGRITVNKLFKDKQYADYHLPEEGQHFCGYIFDENYLCVSDFFSKCVTIIDLVKGTQDTKINLNSNFGAEIIPWDYNLAVVGCENGFAVIDIYKRKLVKKYKLDEDSKSVKGIKKINVKGYGKCLIASCWDQLSVTGKGDCIKLFVI